MNFFTGERLEGGRWLKNLDVPLDEMPVYVRQGATIPVYPDEVECTDDMDLSKKMCIRDSLPHPLSRNKQTRAVALSRYRTYDKKVVEVALYAYTLYRRTKP